MPLNPVNKIVTRWKQTQKTDEIPAEQMKKITYIWRYHGHSIATVHCILLDWYIVAWKLL